ncbi:MAG: ATP-binding protein [Verrucomicrobiota bacterium]
MKIFNSIKWRLQIWYGLILVSVLTGFGLTAFQLERNRQFRRIDEELQRRFSAITMAVRPPPNRGPNANRQSPERPLPRRSDDLSPLKVGRLQTDLHLPPQVLALFDSSDRNGFFYSIEFRDGRAPLRSTNAPNPFVEIRDIPPGNPADEAVSPPDARPKIPQPATPSTSGMIREIVQKMPQGMDTVVRVGCSIAPEMKELQITALKLAGVGGVVLFFGLTGGWWLVGRALKPVTIISATAAKISAGDLSQRIEVDEVESELGQLAAVLNSTFARLESAFAQQRQFASDAAHELRTPVSVILTQTQSALNRERDAASYRQTIEACQRAAQRMRKLIETLLELARFDAGQEALKRLSFDFSRSISGCADLVRPLAEARGVRIFSELSPVAIIGDPERLEQVVTNLLTNAIQYNQPAGEARVKLAAEGGLAVLTIADTGQGIAPDDLPRVFERFYRGDKSRTGGGNAGLGLSICKSIIEAHGGTIEVMSGQNIGTTFIVRLPVSS